MKRYPFEKKIFKRVEVSSDDFDVLDIRLGLSSSASLRNSNIKNKVDSFVNTYNGNINWYMKAIFWERFWKRIYMLITIVLIFSLPIAIFQFTNVISYLNDDVAANRGFEYYSSYVLAILTSVFAFHNVLNAWLAKRRLLSIFHEASSNLKAKLYAFEDKWNNGGVYDSTNRLLVTFEFDRDIEESIALGRSIVNNERKKFYESIESTEINLSNILTSSFNSASSLLTSLQSRMFKRKLSQFDEAVNFNTKRQQLRKEIGELKKEYMGLKKLKETTQANMATSNPIPDNLINMLSIIQTKMNNIQIILIEKESKI